MRTLRIVLGTFLLSTLAITGLAFASVSEEQQPEMEAGKICGAWEWIGGTSFRRGCSEGSLYWYEYR